MAIVRLAPHILIHSHPFTRTHVNTYTRSHVLTAEGGL